MGGGGVFFCLFLRILKNPLIWFSIGVKKDPVSSSKSILSDFGGAIAMDLPDHWRCCAQNLKNRILRVHRPWGPSGGNGPPSHVPTFCFGPFQPQQYPRNPRFTPNGGYSLTPCTVTLPMGIQSVYGSQRSKNRFFDFGLKLLWDGQNGLKTPQNDPKSVLWPF